MLSGAAFNALLKTLEEPPEHVMFIFATTEVQKIPITILSRCQKHDLGRISLDLIAVHLQELCKKENFEIKRKSLDLIAKEADGSIRDALSLLDRLLSSSGTKEINYEDILDGLGVLDRQIMYDISAAIIESNGTKLIEIIEKINDSGIDLKKFYSDIIVHFRNMNVIKICGKDYAASNMMDSEKQEIFSMVSSLPNGFVNAVLQTLLDEEPMVRYSSHTRTAIEMVLLKLFEINAGAHLDKIIDRLDKLVKLLNSGAVDKEYKIAPEAQKGEELFVKEDIEEPEYHPDTQSFDDNLSDTPTEWQKFLKKLEPEFPYMFNLLNKGSIKETNSEKIIIELDQVSSFDKSRLENKKNELKKMSKEFLKKELIIEIILKNEKSVRKNEKKPEQSVLEHPVVAKALEMFNGEIVNY